MFSLNASIMRGVDDNDFSADRRLRTIPRNVDSWESNDRNAKSCRFAGIDLDDGSMTAASQPPASARADDTVA
jgi:hypothetical protein